MTCIWCKKEQSKTPFSCLTQIIYKIMKKSFCSLHCASYYYVGASKSSTSINYMYISGFEGFDVYPLENDQV